MVRNKSSAWRDRKDQKGLEEMPDSGQATPNKPLAHGGWGKGKRNWGGEGTGTEASRVSARLHLVPARE